MGDRTTRVNQQGRALPVDGLTDTDVDVYGRLAAGEDPQPGDEPAVARLKAHGLLADGTGRPVVLPPTNAAWTLAEDALANLSQQIQLLDALPRTIEAMSVLFNRSRFRAGSGSEFLAERDVVNQRMEKILAGAQFELLGAHPHKPRTREQMELGVPRDKAAIDRGVRYRTLYQDVVRDDAVSCEWASTMAQHGAQYRTLMDPFERVIIVDRKIAVISDYVMEAAPEGAAWIITDRAMVGFCAHAFEQEWRRGTVWHGERRQRGLRVAGRLSEVQKSILRALSENQTLDGLARRMSVSKRSLQREVDGIRSLWGMPGASLATLTFHWATSPERDVALEQAA